ncbi:MAG: hypothetical protein RMK01_12690 [Thermomicrobium sp.]|nr:hypothetical protein [Thermomicrobium sp.]
MRRGTLRSFLGGLALGTALGALAVWVGAPQRREIPAAWRERAQELAQQAKTQGERFVASVRERLRAAQQSIEPWLPQAGMASERDGVVARATTTDPTADVTVSAES